MTTFCIAFYQTNLSTPWRKLKEKLRNCKYSNLVPPASLKKILLNSFKIDGKHLISLIHSIDDWCTPAIWITKVMKNIEQNIFRFHLIHRVSTEWQWPLSGVHSIMMEKSAQPWWEWGCRPTPFHYIYFRAHTVVVNDPVEREDIQNPISTLPLCVLCDLLIEISGNIPS
jgi:hypothetical protein